MPNRLAHETSPYLLQHANNPVDWYPWGEEALAKSKREGRPIFLSVGYSACHWCHVMEHESFENEEIAAALNHHFVCIKVDREERPDLDQIYMTAVQLMTRHGGWPMSVFLTPDLKPFYGGTYWPPDDRGGMPGFLRVIEAVADAWTHRRADALAQADELTEHLRDVELVPASGEALKPQLLAAAVQRLERDYDPHHGGFGRAPKFPHPMDLAVILRQNHRQPDSSVLKIVTHTLERMARGGIYDHLGGGFARYSVDERWLVPHFEKMLYDNALLAGVYLDAYLVTGNEDFARIARETCQYVLNDMTDPCGGFHSTEDADSEGEEGLFYVWTLEEISELLGPERAARFCWIYGVTPQGNFEERNILSLPRSLAECAAARNWELPALEAELAADRAVLLEAREQRIRPGKDDKILVSWNALMIDALARVGSALNEPRFVAAAQRAAEFVLSALRDSSGRLLHSYRAGSAKFAAYLDDYAYLANALVTLYEADGAGRWLPAALELADTMLARFHDAAEGGFFYTADDHEQLIARKKDFQDSSVPSANGMAATALLRLAALTGREDLRAAALGTLALTTGLMEKVPIAAGQLLIAADWAIGPVSEYVLVHGSDPAENAAALASLQRRYAPRRVLAQLRPDTAAPQALAGLLAGRTAVAERATLYICENFACRAPVVGSAAIEEAAK